jgi:hypothetical protein
MPRRLRRMRRESRPRCAAIATGGSTTERGEAIAPRCALARAIRILVLVRHLEVGPLVIPMERWDNPPGTNDGGRGSSRLAGGAPRGPAKGPADGGTRADAHVGRENLRAPAKTDVAQRAQALTGQTSANTAQDASSKSATQPGRANEAGLRTALELPKSMSVQSSGAQTSSSYVGGGRSSASFQQALSSPTGYAQLQTSAFSAQPQTPAAPRAAVETQALREAPGQARDGASSPATGGVAQAKSALSAPSENGSAFPAHAMERSAEDSKLSRSGVDGAQNAKEIFQEPYQRASAAAIWKAAGEQANAAERANISRFLQPPGDLPTSKELAEALRRLRENATGDEYRQGSLGRREAFRTDVFVHEQGEDPRGFQTTLAAKDQGEAGQLRDKRSAEKLRDGAAQDHDAHCAAGFVETREHQDEIASGRGLREIDVLDDKLRCHGLLADGTRCLRRSQEGTRYCREHAFHTAALELPEPIAAE